MNPSRPAARHPCNTCSSGHRQQVQQEQHRHLAQNCRLLHHRLCVLGHQVWCVLHGAIHALGMSGCCGLCCISVALWCLVSGCVCFRCWPRPDPSQSPTAPSNCTRQPATNQTCLPACAVFYALWTPFMFMMGYNDPRRPGADHLYGEDDWRCRLFSRCVLKATHTATSLHRKGSVVLCFHSWAHQATRLRGRPSLCTPLC